MGYWEECVTEALEEAGICATKEQIDTIAFWVEGARENYRTAFGYNATPNPMNTEVDRLKSQIKRLEDQHEKQLYGIKKSVATSRNVSVHDVHIKDDGDVRIIRI